MQGIIKNPNGTTQYIDSAVLADVEAKNIALQKLLEEQNMDKVILKSFLEQNAEDPNILKKLKLRNQMLGGSTGETVPEERTFDFSQPPQIRPVEAAMPLKAPAVPDVPAEDLSNEQEEKNKLIELMIQKRIPLK